MDARMKAMLEWFDEVVSSSDRDERILFSLWQSLYHMVRDMDARLSEEIDQNVNLTAEITRLRQQDIDARDEGAMSIKDWREPKEAD